MYDVFIHAVEGSLSYSKARPCLGNRRACSVRRFENYVQISRRFPACQLKHIFNKLLGLQIKSSNVTCILMFGIN